MKKFFSSIRVGAWALTGVLAAGLLFTACNKDHNNDQDTPVAGLMAFNLSPDVTAAGFSISGNQLTSGPLNFNSFTGGYLSIYPGNRAVESFNYNNGGSLASTTFNFEATKYYSVFLVGADSSYQNIVVNDDIDSLSGSGQAFVRYINAIPDASTPTVTVAVNGSNVVNDNAAFASVSQFAEVSPGSITIHVTNGGTIDATRSITVEERGVYTILLAGKPGGTGDNAVQIKFIQNGTLDATTGTESTSSAKAVK